MTGVAIVLDAPPTAWIARAIERVATLGPTSVVLLPGALDRHATAPGWFHRYQQIDRRLLGGSGADPFAPVEPATLPAHVVQPRPSEDVVAFARGLGAGIVVDLTTTERLRPAHGVEVWVLRHDGEPAAAPGSVLRTFASGATTCTSELVARQVDGERVLYRTRSLVRRLSLQRTRAPIFWKTAALPARALGQPRRDLGTPVPRRTPDPSATDAGRLGVHLLARAGRSLHDRVGFRPSWSIAWRQASERTAADGAFVPTGRLDPPPDSFYADPFLAAEDGRHYLFYEAYRRRLGRAELVAQEIGGSTDAPRTILARPYHLSYPFVFAADGEHYLLPESADGGRVELFRADAFPWSWRTDTTLLEGVRAYDPTLIEHGGRYFLFAAVPEPDADIDELHLYVADDLRGPYRPHPLNPIVSDVATSRPAGRIYRERGRLVRPAQDGSGGYGSALVLNEIVRLGPDEYEERPQTRIAPRWDESAVGMHTIDYDGSFEVVDVKTRQPRRRWARA